jgi:hypothetical protein
MLSSTFKKKRNSKAEFPLHLTVDKVKLQAAMFPGRISEVPASYPGQRPATSTDVFVVSHYLQVKSEVVHEMAVTASCYSLLIQLTSRTTEADSMWKTSG